MKSSVSQTVVVLVACVVLSLRLHVTTTATATATDTPTHRSRAVAAHKAFSEWLDVTQMHTGAPVSAATARVGDKLARQVRRLMGVHTRPFPTLRPMASHPNLLLCPSACKHCTCLPPKTHTLLEP